MKKLIYTLALALILNSAFYIQNSNAQWVTSYSGIGATYSVYSIASSGTNLVAGTYSKGVYTSTNNGQNWTQSAFNNKSVKCLAVSGSTVYAGTNDLLSPAGVWVSNTNGLTWTQTSMNNRVVNALLVNGTSIFAGVNDNGIWVSSNGGTNWTKTTFPDISVKALAISGSYIFAGTVSSMVGYKGVWVSTNNGSSWTSFTATADKDVYSLAVNGSSVFAGTSSNGVIYSNNSGTNWTQSALNNKSINSVVVYSGNVFAGTFAEGVYLSTNNGVSWIPKNQGWVSTSLPTVYTVNVLNNYVFAGTDFLPLYRRVYSESIGIRNISSEIPSAYSLSQNFPNPFNPTTVIRFGIPNTSVGQTFLFVDLKVFDITGREVQTLVNEQLAPGTYEATFDGTNLPSGTYFYKLTSSTFSQTKRLTLLK